MRITSSVVITNVKFNLFPFIHERKAFIVDMPFVYGIYPFTMALKLFY